MLNKGPTGKARDAIHTSTVHDGTATKNTESQFLTSDREKTIIMLYDRIAPEKHVYVTITKAESIQISRHCILTLNSEGPQQPLNERPDFAQAKRECKLLHDEHLTRTQEEF